MSSYLNLYMLPKEGKKKLLFYSVSRNSNIYQAFNEYGIAYSSNEEKYTLVTKDMMSTMVNEAKADLDKWNKRLEELEKHAAGNAEIIEDIISSKEYQEELQDTYNELCFIRNIVADIEMFDFFDIEGIYANIS